MYKRDSVDAGAQDNRMQHGAACATPQEQVRGAAVGLNIAIPYAEPAYANLRGGLAIDPPSST